MFTPQEVNDLERSAYMAGMSVERQRYEQLLENKIMMTQLDFAGYMADAKIEAYQDIINLINNTYNNPKLEEYGSMVWTNDIVELIENLRDRAKNGPEEPTIRQN